MIFRAAAFILLIYPCAAQQPQRLSLASSIERALESHPEVAAAKARVGQAEGARVQAGLAPNPQLVLQHENLRRSTSQNPFSISTQTDNFAYIQQQFEPGGKRSRRVDAARSEMEVLSQQVEVVRLEVARQVRQAYWAAAGAQQMLRLLEATRETFQQIVEYHEIRVKEGAMAAGDLLRVRLEADRIALSANQARLEAQRARIELFRAMGQSRFPEVELSDPLTPPEDPLMAPDVELALGRRPDIAAARARVEAARAGLSLARANARTDYSLFMGLKRTEGFNTLMGGVQWDLPVRNRNEGNIQAGAASIRTAEAELAAAEALARAEIEAAHSDYLIRRRQLQDFVSRLGDQARETSQIAVAAYRLGGADLLRLLDAERLRIEIEMLQVRARAEYRQSRAALESSLGVIQ